MKYMLDTDTFFYLVNGIPQVLQRYTKVVEHEVGLSVVSYGEVLFGISKQQPSASKQKRIDYLLDQMPIALMDEDVARSYGQVRSALERSGKPIGPNDTWIAAHALSLGATLVTGNLREYKRVAGLKIENWLE
jgi:tRNA(fMet)-specific endonuclease VapC